MRGAALVCDERQRFRIAEVVLPEPGPDQIAVRNLASLVAGSSPETVNACGAEGSGQENGLVKPAPAKQEPSSRKLAASAVGNKRL
jgi:hypothetical protein